LIFYTVYVAAVENRLLNGHLVVRSLVKTAADIRILAFVVLADDAEINLARLPLLQRAFDAFKQAHRPQVYILTETPANRDKKSP
jgi:hypothetical protein